MRNDIQFLNFSPFLTRLSKGLKSQKNLIGDRQKTDIEGTRRIRNHRPTRKRKTRCYGHKGKKNTKQRKKKSMQGYLDRSRRCQKFIEKKPTLMDRETVEDVSSRQRAQGFGLMDRPICRETIKVKPRNLDRRGICQEAIEDTEMRFFKEEKKKKKTQGDKSNKQATQPKIHSTC